MFRTQYSNFGRTLASERAAFDGQPNFRRFVDFYGTRQRPLGARHRRLDSTTTAAVPEPAAWALMLTGFGLVGATMRRRQAAVVA